MRILFMYQKLSVFLSFLVLSLLFAGQAIGQAPGVTINTSVKNSDCAADGTITVNLTGWQTNYENPTYSAKEKSGKYSTSLQTSKVLQSLPSGTYNVTVRLKKKGQNSYVELVKNDVVVGGNYVELTGGLDAVNSRHAFKGCPTGKINVFVYGSKTDNNNNLRFTIESAELGIAKRPVGFGRRPGSNSFKLDGETYMPGNYIVRVNDGCMELAIPILLPEIKKLPEFTAENHYILYAGLSPAANQRGYVSDCNSIVVKLNLTGETVNTTPLYQYISAGAFEVALAPDGVEPADNQYQTMEKNPLDPNGRMEAFYKLSLGAGRKVSDYYGKKLKVKVRFKACPQISREFTIDLNRPSLSFEGANTSNQVSYPVCGMRQLPFITPQLVNIFCYPITIKAKEIDNDGYVVTGGHETSEVLNSFRDNSKMRIYLNRRYQYDVFDANGNHVSTQKWKWEHKVDKKPLEFVDCMKKYILPFKFVSLTPCYPYTIEVRNNGSGALVQTISINNETEAAAVQKTIPLEFNVGYKITAKQGNKVLYQFDQNESFSREPVKYNSVTGQGYCGRDRGTLNVTFRSNYQTVKTLIVKKEGKEIARGKTAGKNYWAHVEYANMPKGKYVLEVQTEGCSYDVPFDWNGFYNRENFSYTAKRTCEGLLVTPTGRVSHEGSITYIEEVNKVPVTKDVPTYFRIISGPTGGFEKKSFKLGEDILLTVSGKYKLGITESYIYGTCALDTIEIDYQEVSVQFSTPDNAAYACKDGTQQGHILAKGIEGVGPYSYELWKADKTAPILGGDNKPLKPLDTSASGVVHFAYGKAHDTYAVRVTDNCGTVSWQILTISDLTSQNIARTPTPIVCAGDVIMLESLPLVNFKWYRPGGKQAGQPPFSTLQNPMIYGARVEDSGIYEVEVNPPYCGQGVTGSVNITVLPCSAPVNPHLMQRVQRPIAP